jgi:hypothetical protein
LTSGAPSSRARRHRPPRPSAPSDAEIEREIGSARARIGSTLEVLACRLAPDRLLRQGSEMLSRRFGSGPNRHLDRLGLGLIAAGVAAIVVANSGRLWRRRAAGHERDAPEDDDAMRRDEDPEPASGARGPLIFAVLGFAAGAVVALLLPPSRSEERAVAAAREDLWRKAEALGHELAARLRSVAAARAQSPVREGEER